MLWESPFEPFETDVDNEVNDWYDVNDTFVDAATGLEFRRYQTSSNQYGQSVITSPHSGSEVLNISELHYISPIENLSSILNLGILSHRRATAIPHNSVAMEEIQQIRASKRVPEGQRLHDYANLYFNAANPMMYKRREFHRELCVICVSPEVMSRHGVVIADGNAASAFTAFYTYPEGLARIDRTLVFGQSWSDPDPAIHHENRRRRCAEVLVPDQVPPDLIVEVRVSNSKTASSPILTDCGVRTRISERLFFAG